MTYRLGPGVGAVFKSLLSDFRCKLLLPKTGYIAPRCYSSVTERPPSQGHESSNEIFYQQTIDVKDCQRVTLKSHQHSVLLTSAATLDEVIQLTLVGNLASRLLDQPTSNNNFGLRVERDEVTDGLNIEWRRIIGLDRAQLTLQIPFNFHLDVHCFNGSEVQLSGVECRNVSVNVEDAAFKSKNVKCHRMSVYSQRGSITCDGYLIGNTYLRSGEKGNIAVKRIQGNEVQIQSADGDVSVGAVYSQKCVVSCGNANVTLANVHGECDAQIDNGNLRLTGFDGHLTACVSRGDISAQISKLRQPSHSVVMAREGNVELKLSPELKASIRLEGKDVELEEDVSCDGQFVDGDERHVVYQGQLNGAQMSRHPLVVGIAHNGKVNLGMQGWFSNLKHV